MATKYQGTPKEKRALNAFIALMRAAECVGHSADAELEQYDLSTSQFGALEAIYHLGVLSQRELGQKLLKSGGNITMVVNNLEKRSLVKRFACPEDKRVYRIGLTDQGRKLLDKILPQHIQRIVQLMNGIGPTEQEELRRLCRSLGKSVQ